MKDKIIQLRNLRPIPLLEAKQLLLDHDGDIETCVYLYTAKAIKEICDQTGCNSKKAEKYYTQEKYDINRAISFIKDEIYDKNYQTIEGVDKNSLQYIKDWVYVMESENFAYSLSYTHLHKAIDTLLLLPKLNEIGQQMRVVKERYDQIFGGYDDSKPLDEFVRLNRQLDDVLEFQLANIEIPLQVLYIKNEISRHWRNVGI